TVLQGLLKERQKFKSGVAEISGTRLVQVKDQPELNGPIVGLYAFMLDGDKLRYDNQEPQFVRIYHLNPGGARALKNDHDDKPKLVRRRFCFIRNPEYSAQWQFDGPDTRSNIGIDKPTAGPDGASGSIHHMYDVRSAGLIDFTGFRKGLPLQKVVDALLQG